MQIAKCWPTSKKERVLMMNRQKRNRQDKAHTRGYQAGKSKRS